MELAYEFVVQSERPRMAMQQVGVALGLPWATRQSETELALLNQVTREDFSKGVTKFLRMAQLPPALGIKSDAAKARMPTRMLLSFALQVLTRGSE
jgi:hypothetical protein